MKVYVNVYDIQRTCNQKGADVFGLGIYHSGVEICGMEFAYGGNTTLRTTGVYENCPKEHSAFHYKNTICIGELVAKDFFSDQPPEKRYSSISFNRDIYPILDRLMDEYRAYRYDILLKNCNHFTHDFITALFKGKKQIPNYLNRAAYLGSFFHCFVPEKYLTVTPAGREEEGIQLSHKWKEEDMKASRSSEQSETDVTSSPGSFIDQFYTSFSWRSPS